MVRKGASKGVCSPEPEVSFKPPAVCRDTGSPFSSTGSQQSVPGWILIRKGVDAPVIMGIVKPIDSKSNTKEGEIVNTLFVGIDVGSRDNAVYIMLPDGSKHSSFEVQNNLGGAQEISKRVVSAMESKKLSAVTIGMEATSVYGENLLCFLREDGSLGRFERKLFVLNPKQVNKFKLSYSDLPKNDPVDALSSQTASASGGLAPRSTWMTTVIKPCKTLLAPVSTPYKTSRGRSSGS